MYKTAQVDYYIYIHIFIMANKNVDKIRVEPHQLSDSDSEATGSVSVKRKRTTRKTKINTADQPIPVLIEQQGKVSEPSPSKSMASELAEMRKIYAEIKEEGDRNAATLAAFQLAQSQAENLANEVEQLELGPRGAHGSASFLEMEGGHPFDETEDATEFYVGDEEDEEEIDGSRQLSELRAAIYTHPLSPAQASARPTPVAAHAQCSSSHLELARAATPQGVAANVEVTTSNATAVTPTVTTVTTKAPVIIKSYPLDAKLQQGVMLEELKDVHKKFKKPVADRIKVDNNLMGALKHFYSYNKPIKVLKDLSRQYTGLVDIPEARIQLLNEEIKFQEARKLGEDAMLWATKGIVGALTAIMPMTAIILMRGNRDTELNAEALNVLNAIRMLVSAHVQLTNDRLSNVDKVVNSRLGKDIIKLKKNTHGDKPEATEHLLGEDLAERNKLALKKARASDNCMNSKSAYSGKRFPYSVQGRETYHRRTRGSGYFRGGRGTATPRRPYNQACGARPAFAQHKFGRSTDDYNQYGNSPKRGRGAAQGGHNNNTSNNTGNGHGNRGFQK